MVDVIVIVGDEDELLRLGASIDALFCGKGAQVVTYHDIPQNLGDIDRIFLVGHADISNIGEYDTKNIISLLKQFSIKHNGTIVLAGCSTGNATQQVTDEHFFAGKPLLAKIRSWYPHAHLFYTPSNLVRRRDDGSLYLRPSLSQGVTGRETGAECFRAY